MPLVIDEPNFAVANDWVSGIGRLRHNERRHTSAIISETILIILIAIQPTG